MSEYKIINLEELDDVAAGRGTGVEARFARTALESKHLGVSLMRYGAGVQSGMAHSHREQEEAYVVVSGSGRIMLDGEIRDLRQWDVVRVSPAVVRSFAAGPDGLELVAIGSDRPEGGDGTTTESSWPS